MRDATQVMDAAPAPRDDRPDAGVPAQEASFAELTKRLTEQVSRLAHQEIALAKVELSQKGKRMGIGAGMFGAAGVLALFGLGVLSACAVLGLATVMPAWAAALIVGGVYLVAAALLALTGKGQVKAATPLAPTETAESVKEDVQWVKDQAREGRA